MPTNSASVAWTPEPMMWGSSPSQEPNSPEGSFNYVSCFTHNDREFMGGITDWAENLADSTSARDLRRKVSDTESVSMWQSLAYGPNHKAAYCLSMCPAGDDVIAPFLEDRNGFVETLVKPLQAKEETLYVQPGIDAKAYASTRFPHKTIAQTGNTLRPTSIDSFIRGMHVVF